MLKEKKEEGAAEAKPGEKGAKAAAPAAEKAGEKGAEKKPAADKKK